MKLNPRYLFASIGLLAVCLIPGLSYATVQKLEICGVQFQPNEAVPVIREVPTFVVVRGDLVDTHTSIEKNSDISITQTGSTSGGGTNTSITLKITPSASLGTGNHTIKLHYAIELNGPDVFTINVPAPVVTSIKIDPVQSQYQVGAPVTITATGSGLSGAHLNSTFNVLTSIHYTTTSSTTVQFTANVARTFTLLSSSFTMTNLQLQDTCISNHAAGNARLDVSATLTAPPPPIPGGTKGGGTTTPPPQPNLSFTLLNTFRSGSDFSNSDKSTYNVCPSSQRDNPKVTTIGPLTIRVLNSGTANIATPFQVKVTKDGQQINLFTVNSLNTGATTDLVIPRKENRVCGTLDITNPAICHRCGSGVQGIAVWNDVGIQVTVDSGNVIAESNESDNTQTIVQ